MISLFPFVRNAGDLQESGAADCVPRMIYPFPKDMALESEKP